MSTSSVVCFNGQIFPGDSPLIQTVNSSFLRGLGLFETMLVVQGKLPLFTHHWKRLTGSCQTLNLPVPAKTTVEQGWLELCRQCCQSSLCGSLRLTVSQNSDAERPWFDSHGTGQWLLQYQPITTPWESNRSIRLTATTQRVHSKRLTAGHKTTSFADWLLARRQAIAQGFDDGLLLNEHNHCVEASAANLFLVKENQLLTPNLESGCLPGVMRAIVLKQAQKLSLPIQETQVTCADLNQADFVFLTSATTGLLPVHQWEDRTLPAPPSWWPTLIQEVKKLLTGQDLSP